MLIVVQFPMADARGLSSDPLVRLSRPEWGKVGTYGDSFVHGFGRVVDRQSPADNAWVDERYFSQAGRAISLSGLQPTRRMRSAFRRLFVADGRVVVRVEVGLALKLVGEQTSGRLVTLTEQVSRLPSQVAVVGKSTAKRPLITQGRRLARVYAEATTKKGASNGYGRLVEPGRPVIVVDLHPKEAFSPPKGARVIPSGDAGGSDLAFMRLQTESGYVPTWIMRRARDPAQARSLRLCLLRLHAEQECLAAVIRLRDRAELDFVPGSDSADALESYLNTTTRHLNKETWAGISQTAVIAAINAANEVTYPADREGIRQSLEGVQFQIAKKTDDFLRERDAVKIQEVINVGPGGKVIKGSVVFEGTANLNNVSIVNAKQMRDALVTLQAAPVSDDRKQAVQDLVDVATELVEKLPDDQAKADVTKRVELITKQAKEEDPIEEVVRAAGETVVKIGQGVADLAGPIAKAVNTVLAVLKFAPIVL